MYLKKYNPQMKHILYKYLYTKQGELRSLMALSFTYENSELWMILI